MKIQIGRDSSVITDDPASRAGGFTFHFDGFLLGEKSGEHAGRFASALAADGPACVKSLNGRFRGWIKDDASGRVHIFTDRYSGKEIFQCEKNGIHYFDSDFNRLAMETGNPPDPAGIAEFCSFQYPLYEKTFCKNISLFTPGSMAEIDPANGSRTYEQYWSFRYSQPAPGNGKKRPAALWELIENAMKKCAPDAGARYGAGNSGGLDSRIVLFFMSRMGRSTFPYTLGRHPSDATVIAGRVASALGFENTVVPIDPDFLRKCAPAMAESSPMNPALLAWHLAGFDSIPPFDIHLTGFNGDNMLGSHLEPHLMDLKSPGEIGAFTFDHYSIAPEYFAKIFRDTNISSEIRDHFITGIESSSHVKPEDIFEEFNFNCRQLRFIKNSPNFGYLGRHEWRTPFLDNSLMDFMLTMNRDERFEMRLCRETVREYLGDLNRIRYERDPATELDSPSIARLKRSVFDIDRKFHRRYGKSLLFKGNHKKVEPMLREPRTFEYIINTINKENEAFDSIFSSEWIADNLEMIVSRDPLFSTCLLAVKLWMDNVYGNPPPA